MDTRTKELQHSKLYSEELGIELARNDDAEYFKWFLASTLFGGRISETIAKHTYQSFKRHDLLTPRKILRAGWHYLVNPVMREGGYVHYDESKSRQILRNSQQLLNEYGGSLQRLHELAKDANDLESRLQIFHGIGPVTVNIFLRELRPYWRKANPEPLPVVQKIAKQMSVDIESLNRKTVTFTRLEAGLIRLRKHTGNH